MHGDNESIDPYCENITSRNNHDSDMELTQRLYIVHTSGEDAVSCAEQGCVNSLHSHESGGAWRSHPIEAFLPHLSENVVEVKKLPRNVKLFYQKQDAHIRELVKLTTLEAQQETETGSSGNSEATLISNRRLNAIILRVVLLVNVLLLVGKSIASAISGSLSIISSLLDSCVDIASGGIMWFTAREMRKRRPYTYPQGRTRFEPIAIIVLAVFMSTVCLQLSVEAIEAIYRMSKGEREAPNVTNMTLGIMAVTIAIKLALWIICNKFGRTPAVKALKVDQRNDVFSNSASLLFSGLASRLPPLIADPRCRNLKFMDPIGALLISCYILYSWYQIAAEQTRNLAGHTADPRFLQKIAFVSLNHHAAIERLDTIRAFHFGSHFLVEVDIVLPMGMCLKEAHDIGEELQKKLERLENVERAFVHLDYEFSHHPESEHKIA